MKKFAFAGMAALGLAALGISPAAAQTQELCGPADAMCVLSRFELTNGGQNLQMYVFNGSNATSAATQSRLLGLMVNLPGTLDYGSGFSSTFYNYNGVTQTSSATAMTVGYGLTGDVSQAWIDLAAQGANGGGGNSISTCAGPATPGTIYKTCERTGTMFGNTWDYILLNWDLNGVMLESDLALIEWGFRGQSIGPNGDSLKCETAAGLWNGGGALCDETDIPDDPGGPQETVPEPATMTLLATGLVGMAVARRKRNKINS